MPRCNWHSRGLPEWASGTPFFKPGCPDCEDKAAADPGLRQAKSPRDLSRSMVKKLTRVCIFGKALDRREETAP